MDVAELVVAMSNVINKGDNMITSKLKTIILSTIAAMTLSACGNSSSEIIKNAELQAEVHADGDLYASLTTKMDSNNVQIVSMDIPVFNPKNPTEQIGGLRISNPSQGVTQISLLMNVTSLANLQYTLTPVKTLPNGTAFPVVGVNAGSWYAIPLKNSTNSKLYINIDGTKSAVVGYALITDQLASGVVGNIFAPFAAEGVTGYGGVFSGAQPGTSGVAVFADISSVLKKITPNLKTASVKKQITFADKTTEKVQKKIYKHVIKLNVKGEKIRFK